MKPKKERPKHYPDEKVDPVQVDSFLATELNKLSFLNRENINEEIHGVRCLCPEETPQMLEAALEQLSLELADIPCSEKQAFLQSQRLFPNNRYVNDHHFRLTFLRCELFDARKAARRLVRHLDFVFEIFGNKTEILGRPIRLTDLAPKSLKLLRSGCLQLLPVRDSSGRRVFFTCAFKTPYDVIQRVQVLTYFGTVLSEDVEAQRTGFVTIALPGEHSSKVSGLPSSKDRWLLTRMTLSSAVRNCAVHICYPDTPLFRILKAAYALGMQASETTRYRVKFHSGSDTETRYTLMAYGIPVDQIPMTSSGKVKPGGLHQWLNVRTRIETERIENGAIIISDIDLNIIECPGFNDVAIRPGKAYLCHPGNVKFKELLNKYMDEHAAANRKMKDTISWRIIEEIERRNGRFLEWDNNSGFWVENKDRNSFRAKIPVYFRDHKRNIKGKRRQRQLSMESGDPLTPYDGDGGASNVQSFEKKRRVTGSENAECNLKCCINVDFDQ